MQAIEFNEVVETQVKRSMNVLASKSTTYNTDDRLSAFKVAGALQGIDPKAALAGMMAKHTGSVYKMCHSDEPHTISEWEEKITDHINYLLNLRAIVEEEASTNGHDSDMAISKLRRKLLAGDDIPNIFELARHKSEGPESVELGPEN